MVPSLSLKGHSRRDARVAETEGINKSFQKKFHGEQETSWTKANAESQEEPSKKMLLAFEKKS